MNDWRNVINSYSKNCSFQKGRMVKRMGLFGLFEKKTTPERKTAKHPSVKSVSDIPSIDELKKREAESDREIMELQKADAAFREDGDLEKRISVYEEYLLKKTHWNSFNFNLALAEMYFKAGENDKAWGYLNQMYIWALDPDVAWDDTSKIRLQQFKILKSEKKYKDALVMLVSSYVINAYGISGMYFNKTKFKKDMKATAKAIGFLEEDQDAFADDLESKIKQKKIRENDVKNYCLEYFTKLGL